MDWCQQTKAQLSVPKAGNEANQGGAAGAAQIARQSQQGKEGGASGRQAFGGQGEGSGPHDSYR